MIKQHIFTVSLALAACLLCHASYAAEQTLPMKTLKTQPVRLAPSAALISCPDKLHNVNVSINTQYSAPSGWGAKTTPTGYQGQTLTIASHQVLSGKMHCSYGRTSLPSSYRLTTVSRPVPAGKQCTAVSGFKFSCK